MIRFPFVAAAALAALVSLPAAQAADRDSKTLEVSYSDLNLSTQAGVATLRHRLLLASRAVCGDSDSRNMGEVADMLACRDAALEESLRDMRHKVAAAARTQPYAVASATSR